MTIKEFLKTFNTRQSSIKTVVLEDWAKVYSSERLSLSDIAGGFYGHLLGDYKVTSVTVNGYVMTVQYR